MSCQGLHEGQRGLIMGVANASIAWGIAQGLHEAGAELAFSLQGDLQVKAGCALGEPLNRRPARLRVSKAEYGDAAFAELVKVWDSSDFVVHAMPLRQGAAQGPRMSDTHAETSSA